MLGKTLAQYCPTDSALAKEQQRIEAELKAFETNLFGNKQLKDSTDSVAQLALTDKKAAKKLKKSRAAAAKSSAQKASRSRKSTSSAPSSGSARVTVRRQRH